MKQIALSHDRPTLLNTQSDRTPTHVLRFYSLRVPKTTINVKFCYCNCITEQCVRSSRLYPSTVSQLQGHLHDNRHGDLYD